MSLSSNRLSNSFHGDCLGQGFGTSYPVQDERHLKPMTARTLAGNNTCAHGGLTII